MFRQIILTMPNCPICESSDFKLLYHNHLSALSRYGLAEFPGIAMETTEIDLFFCEKCKFGWNNSFDELRVNYQSSKIIESNRFSPRYRAHFKKASEKIKSCVGPGIKSITEIGAGSCDFLSYFDEASERYAIEPSEEINLNADSSITKINEYFSSEKHIIPSDLVVFRQVLEHIANPKYFVRETLLALSRKGEVTHYYIEVPNAGKTFSENRFYDIYYDHCNYFTVESVICLLKECGLTLCELTLEMNKEIICVIASTEKIESVEIEVNLTQTIKTMKTLIKYHLDANQKVILWGAAGNGANLLNTLQISTELIPFVIDKDVNKQGKFIPITGQKIISPEEAIAFDPNVVLIMSQFHRAEIFKECRDIFGSEVILI